MSSNRDRLQVTPFMLSAARVFAADVVEQILDEIRPRPVVHAISWWQRPLGWLGIATMALCGERIVARRVAGPVRECRECQRAVDGER